MTHSSAQVEPVLTTLPALLQTIEGTLAVPTADNALATLAFDGFRYLSTMAFAHSQPALALLYDLEIVLVGIRPGSQLLDFKIYVRLRESVRTQLEKAGAETLIGETLSLAGAISGSVALWATTFPEVQARMRLDMPQCPPSISFVVHPAPEKPNPFHGGGHSFSL
ncbi:hypothetical protein J5J83_15000 [Azoarcus sp. L1K30]|uniref:hypothetical protein n=1 Tax=Azoarcus sp. L1K30 TaxID=2820277 RepID=UPI001B81D01A|nr:hypothetical protein [Azoarcus sp. L1K30]MBR0567429.1 hypothetical protein [Azoarcus sp. L1K30]